MPEISKKIEDNRWYYSRLLGILYLQNLSIKTIKSYHQTLMLFFKYLEEEKQITDINRINKDTVEEYISLKRIACIRGTSYPVSECLLNRGKYLMKIF